METKPITNETRHGTYNPLFDARQSMNHAKAAQSSCREYVCSGDHREEVAPEWTPPSNPTRLEGCAPHVFVAHDEHVLVDCPIWYEDEDKYDVRFSIRELVEKADGSRFPRRVVSVFEIDNVIVALAAFAHKMSGCVALPVRLREKLDNYSWRLYGLPRAVYDDLSEMPVVDSDAETIS